MNAVLSTFLNSSMTSSAMNNLAANLAGVSHSILATPFIGELYSSINDSSPASVYTQRMYLQGMRKLACRLLYSHVRANSVLQGIHPIH